MNLEYEIIKYLKKFNYKPGYVWKPMNYLNGFLVNCIDNNTMLPQSIDYYESNCRFEDYYCYVRPAVWITF